MKSLYWVSGKSCFVGLNLSGFVTNWTFEHYGGICHTFLVFDIEFLGLDWVNLIPPSQTTHGRPNDEGLAQGWKDYGS